MQTNDKEHALIVGAGIGGPALASGLCRLGYRVTLVERRGRSAEAEGAFLGVAPNGMNALEHLGAARAVLERGFPCSAFSFSSSTGKSLGAIDRSRDAERFGWPLVMIRRHGLHETLLDRARASGADIRMDQTLVALDEIDDGVAARFADGTTIEADVVIGCDGLHSRARVASMPAPPAATFSGLWDYGGFAQVGSDPGLRPGVNEMVFGARAFFGAFVTPRGEVWWFHNGPEKLGPSSEEIVAGLLRLHADDPPWIADVLRATTRPLGPWPLHELRGLTQWSRGRVCLLGDAAHAMSPSAGQGASMAIEDALALTLAMRDNPDPESAFTAYERFRRPRVEAVARIARRNGSGKAPGPVGRRFRDLMLPIFLRLGSRAQDRGYAYRFDWTTRLMPAG